MDSNAHIAPPADLKKAASILYERLPKMRQNALDAYQVYGKDGKVPSPRIFTGKETLSIADDALGFAVLAWYNQWLPSENDFADFYYFQSYDPEAKKFIGKPVMFYIGLESNIYGVGFELFTLHKCSDDLAYPIVEFKYPKFIEQFEKMLVDGTVSWAVENVASVYCKSLAVLHHGIAAKLHSKPEDQLNGIPIVCKKYVPERKSGGMVSGTLHITDPEMRRRADSAFGHDPDSKL